MWSLTGVVLAGGDSRRMGTDKATLNVDGERLVDRVVSRLDEVCERVVVASGDGRRLSGLDVGQVADPSPHAGPLAGILAGLRTATTSHIAVIAVDMPRVSADVLLALLDAVGDRDAAVPVVADRVQPLHAIYAVRASARLAGLFDDGERSPRVALQHLDVLFAGPDVWMPADATGAFTCNLNRPEDLVGS